MLRAGLGLVVAVDEVGDERGGESVCAAEYQADDGKRGDDGRAKGVGFEFIDGTGPEMGDDMDDVVMLDKPQTDDDADQSFGQFC